MASNLTKEQRELEKALKEHRDYVIEKKGDKFELQKADGKAIEYPKKDDVEALLHDNVIEYDQGSQNKLKFHK